MILFKKRGIYGFQHRVLIIFYIEKAAEPGFHDNPCRSTILGIQPIINYAAGCLGIILIGFEKRKHILGDLTYLRGVYPYQWPIVAFHILLPLEYHLGTR